MKTDTQVQRTFSMIKPDAVSKNLIGEILRRLANSGFTLAAGKLAKISKQQAEKLYEEHKGKEFYQGLVDFALEGPAFIMVLKREDAVAKLREVIGSTNPAKALPGTIRGDLAKGQELPRNMIHASDSVNSAEREIPIFFKENEIVN